MKRKRWAVYVMKFGKHTGRPLIEIELNDPQYMNWLCGDDFTPRDKGLRVALEQYKEEYDK